MEDWNRDTPPSSGETAPLPEPEVSVPAKVGYTYVPPPRYTFPMGKPELVFALLFLLFSLVMCNGLLYAGANLALAVGILGNLFSTAGYLWVKKHRPDGYSAGILLLSALIAAAFPRSADAGMKALAMPVLLVIPSLAFCLAAGQNRFPASGITSLLDGPQTLFSLGFGRLGESARGIKAACSSSGVIGRKGSSVVLGLVIAVPLLAVVIPLLMFADAAFEGLLDLLPEIRWDEILFTVIIGGFWGWVLYARAVSLQYLPKTDVSPAKRKGLNPITVNTVLISISFVYVAYLVSQLAYFVGGFSGILPEGYTLAQYARRGFFEMAWLCAINLSLIALAAGLVSAQGQTPLSTRLICLFIGAVTLFLVATASGKMLLYIGTYGLTRLRVLTEVFMIWLACTTVLVCIWLFRPRLPYMKAVLLLALVLYAALMWADVDTQVARYNVRSYQSGKLETVDVSHLGSLSDSAVPYLEELTDDANPLIASQAASILRRKASGAYSRCDDLRGWNAPKARAQKILEQYQ